VHFEGGRKAHQSGACKELAMCKTALLLGVLFLSLFPSTVCRLFFFLITFPETHAKNPELKRIRRVLWQAYSTKREKRRKTLKMSIRFRNQRDLRSYEKDTKK